MTDSERDELRVDDEDEGSASDELGRAFGHLRAAAEKLIDKASTDGARTANEAVERAKETALPMLRNAGKKTEELAAKVDPAARAASREAERVIGKLGATAEPLARQMSDGLSKLGERLAGGFKKRPPPED